MRTFLVAARTDRGGIGVSRARVETLMQDLGIDGYFETSAKEGWQVGELAEAIRNAIDWSLPKVSSPELFHNMKEFLLEEKQAGRILSTSDDLYRAFMRSGSVPVEPLDLRAEFETCVVSLESRDLIQRLSFGSLILLQPEMLDSYASALVNSAKDEPDGLGSISEDEAREGSFRMPQAERLSSPEQEKLLLISTIEDLLRHEIALREHTDHGAQLVFPSQLTRDYPEHPEPERNVVIFTFEGPLLNIYATLVVRLSHSGVYEKKEMWRNATTFTAKVGGTCGILLREIEEGRGELVLFFDNEASEEICFQFEQYVHLHLMRRALPASIKRRRIFVCLGCETPVSELQAKRRREREYRWIECNVCGERVSLLDDKERLPAVRPSVLSEMDQAADAMRARETAALTLEGKIETNDFDVFLAHNSFDKAAVSIIADHLRRRGLHPWLDKEQIPPGRWFQDVIQQAIAKIKSAAVFIGPNGLGRWQTLELRSFISQCVNSDIPVIPVLLPGVEDISGYLIFLKELNRVHFSSLDDSEALDNLVWGITGKNPHKFVK
jgi:DNA-directed RNA polymerase subunit RPC12/RpoP